MIKHIDLFMPPNISQYGVLHHFTVKMHEALQRSGVHSRILEAQKNNPKPFLSDLFKEVPDCTLSFNGLLPDNEGRFFCDLVKIPHVACTVDSPNGFFSLANSPYTIITSVDRNACEFFKGIHAKHVLFMPHGVEKHLALKAESNTRPYDVLMLSSAIDFDEIKSQWQKKFPGDLRKVIEDAAELALSDQKISYVQAFVITLDKYVSNGTALDPGKIEFIEILDELETYIRGRDRVELIKAVKDAKVHVFGSSSSTSSWKKLIKNQSNVVIHDGVPFDQSIELMNQSKIVLNSCAWIKNGTHERILTGLNAGAVVITAENEYMKDHFTNGANIIFYRYREWNKVNDIVNQLLSNEDKRKEIALAGHEQVIQHHTWDQRAGVLLKELTPIINKFKAAGP
jgi:spore maturation protein CgeB